MTATLTPTGYDVFFGITQSNMAGLGLPKDPLIDLYDPNISQWNWHTHQIIAAMHPLENITRSRTLGIGGVGPLVDMARWHRKVYPTRKVLLVPIAYGGTPIGTSHVPNWNPATTGDPLTGGDSLLGNGIRQVRAAYNAAGEGSRVVALLVSAGEADSSAHMNGADYLPIMLQIIDIFRGEFGERMPVVFNSMIPESMNPLEPGFNTNAGPYRIEIDAAMQQIQAERELVAYVRGPYGYSQDYPPNHQHYDAPGQRLRGKQYVEQLRYAHANVLGSPVRQVGDIAVEQDIADLVVSWSKPLCRVTDYIVRYRSDGGAWTEVDTAKVETTARIVGVVSGTHDYDVEVKTVNETGESDWAGIATVSSVTTPGQVTGLVGTAAEGAADLDWDDLTGADDYKVEYKASASSTWITKAVGITDSALLAGSLFPGTSYDFRVSGRSQGGYGAVSSTVTVTPDAYGFLLDISGVPAGFRAYSLRLVRGAYAGASIRVVYKDGTQADIGFDGFGNLDTATLLADAVTHASAGNKTTTIKTVYDQSGNGRDLSQATVSKQPIIVDSAGALVADENGRPLVTHDGTDDIFTGTTGDPDGLLVTGGAASAAHVAKSVGDASTRYLWGMATAASAQGTVRYSLCGHGSNSYSAWFVQITNDDGVNALATSTPFNVWDGLRHLLVTVDTGGNVLRYLDAGFAENSRSYARLGTYFSTGGARFALGGQYTTSERNFWKGSWQSVVIWGSALDADARFAVEQSLKAYWQTAEPT